MTKTPPPRRTDAAIAKRRRNHEDRIATELRERGWVCTPPEYILTSINGGPEWGVIWPNGEEEIFRNVPGIPENAETDARNFASQFDPAPRVVTRNTHVTSFHTAWVDAPTQ